VVSRLADEIVTVTDDEIAVAVRFCFERLNLVVEPSGASALAALISGKAAGLGRRVGITLSGGNVDAARFAEILAG
jgi:threonine dehydratase